MSTRVWETALAPSGGVQESQVLRLLFVSEFPLKSVGQAFKKARNGVIPEEHLDEIIGV